MWFKGGSEQGQPCKSCEEEGITDLKKRNDFRYENRSKFEGWITDLEIEACLESEKKIQIGVHVDVFMANTSNSNWDSFS